MTTENERVPLSTGVSQPSTSVGAVFLSYASEDGAAAERVATALRDAGIEVWFDKSELRGGDAWDRSIREQIHNCALFMPIISANAHARVEGYFRLEWKLAVDRSHRMAPDQAYLMPVVIDDTRQNDTRIPDRFRELQWTRLPAGEPTPAFIERVKRLVSHEVTSAPDPRSVSSGALSSSPAQSGLGRRRTGVLYGTIGAVVLLALGFLELERLNRSKPSVGAGASIAVLPLANESGEASQQYFSDGISEDLITALGQFPGLKVIGRTSSFQFRDSKEDSRSIGAKLGVARLLEGSVRKSGDLIRVSADLIDTADGSMQWSEHYDRPYKDLFALQDEITHAVAGALRAKLLPGEHAAAQSERPPSGSLEAYKALLEGKFYYSHETEADVRKAIEHFTVATKLDPHYGIAWCYVSRAWGYLGWQYLDFVAAREAYANARVAAQTVLALAPGLACSHIVRAKVLYQADFDWRGAEAEFHRALAIAPEDGDVQAGLGYILATLGQVEKAIDLTRQGLTTDPLIANNYLLLALYFNGLNRLEEAERAIRKAIELQPTAQFYHAVLTSIEVRRGDALAALAAAQREPPGFFQDAALARALQIGGDRAAADAALKNLIDQDAGSDLYEVAQVYAIRNDPDKTFEWLDRAWSSRDPGIAALHYDPFILRYRDDPRLAAFCRKVGLPTPAEVAVHKT